MRMAVVGHVEWAQFVRVEGLPSPGEIVHAAEFFEQAGGGGGVAAVRLARLAGGAELFTALGDDELGRRAHEELSRLGVRVHAAWVDEPQRRAITFLDATGERTIVVVGDRLVPRGRDRLPWEELEDVDGVYFTGGDTEALRATRRARVLVATPRALDTLRKGRVQLDALVGSARDEGETYRPGDLEPRPKLYVGTMGSEGGVSDPGGPFPAAPRPGPLEDAYGAGDSFAAGLTFALAEGLGRDEALALASRCGAAALTEPGAYRDD